LPNVQSKKLQSELLGETLKVRVTTRALRCIDRAGGLDNYLLTTRNTSIASLFGTDLKRRVASRYEEVNGVKFSRTLARRQQQQEATGSLKF
jgi:large subunit ribosomal protein L28